MIMSEFKMEGDSHEDAMVRALVSMWLKRGYKLIQNGMENAKNHSQLNNQDTALGP